MILTRRDFFLAASAACMVKTAKAAEGRKRIAILQLGTHALIDTVVQSIREVVAERFGEGVAVDVFNANFQPDMLRQGARQMVYGGYDVLVPVTTSASIEIINLTPPATPIVFSFVSTPDALWGDGGNRPRNVTGCSDQIDYERNIGLIRAVAPQSKKIGYLVNTAEANAHRGQEVVKSVAPKFGFSVLEAHVGAPGEVANAARVLAGDVDAFLVGGDNTVVSGIGALLGEAASRNKPVFAVEISSVENGCVAAYGIDYSEFGRVSGVMVGDVLAGADPGTREIQYFRETRLFVNRLSAQQFGVSFDGLPVDRWM